MQEKDQHLCEIQERLVEYEQRIEEYQKILVTIKHHLQFNERFTRMLTRENQILRLKQAHIKEQQFKSPDQERKDEDGLKVQEKLRREIHALYKEQET